MKTNKIIFACAVLALIAAASCTKPVQFSHGIGLISEFNVLKADPSTPSTPILVYSNTNWTAKFQKEVTWASLDRVEGSGIGQVKFLFQQNFGRSRSVVVQFDGGGETACINMWQQPAIADANVKIDLHIDEWYTDAFAQDYQVVFETNLVYQKAEFEASVSYPEEDASWVRNVAIDPEKNVVSLSIEENPGTAPRTANVRIGHTDAGSYDEKGVYSAPVTIYSNTLTITQQGREE